MAKADDNDLTYDTPDGKKFCRCSKRPQQDQKVADLPDREMIRLPEQTTKQKLVLFACERCDGPTVELAMRAR